MGKGLKDNATPDKTMSKARSSLEKKISEKLSLVSEPSQDSAGVIQASHTELPSLATLAATNTPVRSRKSRKSRRHGAAVRRSSVLNVSVSSQPANRPLSQFDVYSQMMGNMMGMARMDVSGQQQGCMPITQPGIGGKRPLYYCESFPGIAYRPYKVLDTKGQNGIMWIPQNDPVYLQKLVLRSMGFFLPDEVSDVVFTLNR